MSLILNILLIIFVIILSMQVLMVLFTIFEKNKITIESMTDIFGNRYKIKMSIGILISLFSIILLLFALFSSNVWFKLLFILLALLPDFLGRLKVVFMDISQRFNGKK